MLATKTPIRPSTPSDDWPFDRTWLNDFAARLSRFDVVSFDVFDTAITRRCDAPVDAFALAEERLLVEIGEDVSGFAVARELAEQDAREAVKALGREEVTLAEIYAALPQRLPDAGRYLEQLKSAELKAEADLLFGVPEILEAVRLARQAGKKVIFVSDMYLSGAQIRQFLEKAGYTNFSGLLVSSDTGCLKWSGRQWATVRERLGHRVRILHVGDDPVTDVAAPREHGIETLAFTRLRSNRRIGGPVGPAVLPFSRAARSWTIRHQQPQENVGLKPTDFMVGFGASWGVVVVGSYIRWLEERVRRCGIEHLLFMARDAWLLQRAWKAAGCEVRTGVGGTYLYASRRTLYLAEAGNDLTENALSRLCTSIGRQTLRIILDRSGLLGCTNLVTEAVREIGELDAIVNSAQVEKLRSLLQRHRRTVLAELQGTREATLGYLAQQVPDSRRLGIVDLGWLGTLQTSFAKLMRELGRDVMLGGFYYNLFPEAQRARPHAGWLEGAFGNDFVPIRDQFGAQNAIAILESLHSPAEGTTVNYRFAGGRYEPVLGDDAVERAQHELLISPFQRSALEAIGELFTAGHVGALRLNELIPAAGRAAIERVALSPSADELMALGQIRHSGDFAHAVLPPLVPPYNPSFEASWPVGAALAWLNQGHERSQFAAWLRNSVSETDSRTIRQFT